MKTTDLKVLLCFVSVLVEVKLQGVAFVRFLDRDLRNHSYVDFNLVRGADAAVECRSDLRTCCSDTHTGDWFFPNGERLPRDPDFSDIFAARRFRIVQVRRKNFVNTTGIYRCEIETSAANNDSREIVYAGLYSIGGNVAIPGSIQLNVVSDLRGESPHFILTCISTGGPATYVTWTRDSEEIPGEMTVLDNPITAEYTHTLTVSGRLPGQYQCTVSNDKPSSTTRSFTMQNASAPTNLMAVQEGPSGIRVSWNPPSPQGHTSGYRILYSGGSSGSVDVSDGSTDNHLLIGLLNEASYNISIVGTSEHFFSDQVDYPNSIQLSTNNLEGNTGGVGIGAAVGGVIAAFLVVAVIAVLWCCRKRLKQLFSSICCEFPGIKKHPNVSTNDSESTHGENSPPQVAGMNEFGATSMEQLPAGRRNMVSKLTVETDSTKQEPATIKPIAVANVDTHVDGEHIT